MTPADEVLATRIHAAADAFNAAVSAAEGAGLTPNISMDSWGDGHPTHVVVHGVHRIDPERDSSVDEVEARRYARASA